MAFQIDAHGSREGVTKRIKEAKPMQGTPDPDAQLEAAKVFLLAEINGIDPEKFNGLHVTAVGQVSAGGGRVTQITVIPQQLHL